MSVAMPTKLPTCATLQVGSTTNRMIWLVAEWQQNPCRQGLRRDGKVYALVKSSGHRPPSDPSSGDTHHEHTTITGLLGALSSRTSAARGCRKRLLGARQPVRAAQRHRGHAIAEGPHRPVQLGNRAHGPRGLNQKRTRGSHRFCRRKDASPDRPVPIGKDGRLSAWRACARSPDQARRSCLSCAGAAEAITPGTKAQGARNG